MKRKIQNDNRAVSHPIEFTIAFSIMIVSLSLVFLAANNIFASYEKDDFVLRAKAIAISERLIADTGISTNGEIEWEHDISKLLSLGLASNIVINDTWYQPPPIIADTLVKETSQHRNSTYLGVFDDINITKYSYYTVTFPEAVREKFVISNKIDYGTLDYDKIYALNNILYNDAKNAIGLESQYNFNIKIQDKDGNEILRYGRSYKDADLFEYYSRNVRVYQSYSTNYVEAELTVYVF